jgi:hypothetical protein
MMSKLFWLTLLAYACEKLGQVLKPGEADFSKKKPKIDFFGF